MDGQVALEGYQQNILTDVRFAGMKSNASVAYCMVIFAFAVSIAPLCSEDQTNPATPNPQWSNGPTTVNLCDFATLRIPEDCAFLDRPNTLALLERMGSMTSGFEAGLIASMSDDWSVVVELRKTGYVPDADWDPVAAKSLLDTIRSEAEQANEIRRRKGWPTVRVLDWETTPDYDPANHSMEWSVTAASEGTTPVNRTIARLIRRGLINFILVDRYENPDATGAFKEMVRGLVLAPGERYEDSRPGDEVSIGGLTSVISGSTERDRSPAMDVELSDSEPPPSTNSYWWLTGTMATLLAFLAGRKLGRHHRRNQRTRTRLAQIQPGDPGGQVGSLPALAVGESVAEPDKTSATVRDIAVQSAGEPPGRRHRRYDAYSFHQRLTRDLHWTIRP